MGKNQNIIEAIRKQGMLPLFYHPDFDVSKSVVNALYEGGIRIIEYTNRGEQALENFKMLLDSRDNEWPDLLLAIGTIKTVKEAKNFCKAGADFIICPGVVEEVAEKVKDEGLLWIPGCMTTTEIMLAESCGAKLVKLFPGNLLGPGFVSAIRDLFPDLEFMPTGGVEVDSNNLSAWFKSGVSAVGMGSKLISKPLLDTGNYEEIKSQTRFALELIRGIRN